MSTNLKLILRRLFYPTAVLAIVIGGILATGLASSAATSGTTKTMSVSGGIAVYQVKKTGLRTNLGSQSNPTTLANKAVPAGRYLVSGDVNVNVQPKAFIVCAISNVRNGNDGVFGLFNNQASTAAPESVHESEVITVQPGQSIHLTCDDNTGQSHDTVGSAVLEATPVNALH